MGPHALLGGGNCRRLQVTSEANAICTFKELGQIHAVSSQDDSYSSPGPARIEMVEQQVQIVQKGFSLNQKNPDLSLLFNESREGWGATIEKYVLQANGLFREGSSH